MTALSESGWRVWVVTRHARAEPLTDNNVVPLVADVTDLDRWRLVLESARPEEGGWDLAVAYMPFAAREAWSMLAAAVSGRLVAVLTSEVAEPGRTSPALPPLPGPATVAALVLGWRGNTTEPTWHSPRQISAAALPLAVGGPTGPVLAGLPSLGTSGVSEGVILGAIRPWRDRPTS